MNNSNENESPLKKVPRLLNGTEVEIGSSEVEGDIGIIETHLL